MPNYSASTVYTPKVLAECAICSKKMYDWFGDGGEMLKIEHWGSGAKIGEEYICFNCDDWRKQLYLFRGLIYV